MQQMLAAFGLIALVVGGCAPMPNRPAASLQPAEPLSQPGGTASPTTVDTSIAARPSDQVRAVLVDADGPGLRARPIHPGTLADLPGYVPISFGHNYVARVSPDGRTIAAILWPSGSATGGAKIHLIDTVQWVDRELETPITNYTSALHFDERGTSVYWVWPRESQLTPSVFALDVTSGHIREVARLAQGFYARDLVVGGGRVAVYLVPANAMTSGQVGDPREAPRIALVDTRSGLVMDVPLPVRAGQYHDAAAPADEPFRSIEPGLAWDLPRSRLYVADAETDRVFVVDLRTGQIAGPFDPKPKRSLLDVIWTLFGSVAEAKMVSTSRQHAAISPDGTRLYITGLRSDFAKAPDGKYHETVTPLQLRVIDTSDMSELARLDGATTRLWLAPDGASLLFGDNQYDQSVEGWAARSDFRLHVVNTASNERVTLPLGGVPMLTAFDARARTAFVSVQHFAGASLGHASLSLIDLGRGRVVASRVMDRHFADVIPLAGP
jgi:hypothetical protein